jgi:mannose/fructose/N-acetylgalactosamine-specific phosphotransferase system component IIC
LGHWAIPLLGGLLALDETTVGQFMVSRPIVAGVLAGWLIGDPVAGIGVGAFMELFSLVALPAGGARLAATPSGTVAAVATAAALPMPGALPLALLWGLVLAEVGGYGVDRLRHWNASAWARVEERGLSTRDVVLVHWRSIVLDGVRGALIAGVGAWLGRLALGGLAGAWPLDAATTAAFLLLAVSVDLGALLKNFGGWSRRRVVFLFGIVVGIGVGVFG